MLPLENQLDRRPETGFANRHAIGFDNPLSLMTAGSDGFIDFLFGLEGWYQWCAQCYCGSTGAGGDAGGNHEDEGRGQ